jgi:hypothetical protein
VSWEERRRPSQSVKPNQQGRVASPILAKKSVMRREEEPVTEYQTKPAGASCTFQYFKEDFMGTARTDSVIKTDGASNISHPSRDGVMRTDQLVWKPTNLIKEKVSWELRRIVFVYWHRRVMRIEHKRPLQHLTRNSVERTPEESSSFQQIKRRKTLVYSKNNNYSASL